jgi:hypothetical protein
MDWKIPQRCQLAPNIYTSLIQFLSKSQKGFFVDIVKIMPKFTWVWRKTVRAKIIRKEE